MIGDHETKWLRFVLQMHKSRTRTDAWAIQAKSTGEVIGTISWYGRWRTYAFLPFLSTVFEPTCLRDIAAFIDKRMQQRKAAK